MLGRKFDPRAAEYKESGLSQGASHRTATLPTIFGLNRTSSGDGGSPGGAQLLTGSPALRGPSRNLAQRAMSTPGAAPVLYHYQDLEKRRPSHRIEHLSYATSSPPPPQVNERCVDIFGQIDSGKSGLGAIGAFRSPQAAGLSSAAVDGDLESNSEKVKVKLMSIWNNVKYGWNVKLKTNFSYDAPIWFLGVIYHRHMVDSNSSGNHQHMNGHGHRLSTTNLDAQRQRERETALEMFRQDYFSRIWLTYRRSFPRLEGSLLTSDCGWGCMLRSGQMMLAHAFLVHYLGRSWRWSGSQSDKNDMIHRMIVKWFVDEPESPFSLHRIVKIGAAMGKRPGDWYGPATVSHVLNQALTEGFLDNPILENVTTYVAQDCTVYIDEVIKLCTEETSSRRRASAGRLHARSRASSVVSSSSAFETELAKISAAEEQLRQELINETPPTSTTVTPATAGSRMSVLSSRAQDAPFAMTTRSGGSVAARMRNNFVASKAASTINLYEGPAATGIHSSAGSTASSQTGDSGIGMDPKRRPSTEVATSEKWRGIVIFIPVRLGGEKFNPVYAECVRNLFSHPASLGIIGGRPRHSLYFVGAQDDKLIYLDPHLCQDAVDQTTSTVNFPLESFHCNDPRKMAISKMDPSCTLAFYCRTRDEFMELTRTAKEFVVPGHRHTDYPMFVFAEGSTPPPRDPADEPTERLLKVKHRFLDSQGNVEAESMSEDFVLIS